MPPFYGVAFQLLPREAEAFSYFILQYFLIIFPFLSLHQTINDQRFA